VNPGRSGLLLASAALLAAFFWLLAFGLVCGAGRRTFVEGMGHNLPREAWPLAAAAIVTHVRRVRA
jgi:hypothetical protein